MKKMYPGFRRISEGAWLRALRRDSVSCHVALAGVAGRFRTPSVWDTGVITLRQHLVYLFADNEGRFQCENRELVCLRGSCAWVTPGIPFRFYSEPGECPLIYRFRFEVEQGGRSLTPPGHWYLMEEAGNLLETVKTLMRENRPGECWEDERRRALLLQFSVEMFQKPERAPLSGFSDAQRMALQREIDERPAARMSAKEMAIIVGLSVDYFTRVFRRTYGLSPRAWVLRERLRHAALLLEESTLRVGEIAMRLGYEDPYLFSRQFRSQFGCSPRCWRKKAA